MELSDATYSAMIILNIANESLCNNNKFLDHLGVCELMKKDVHKSERVRK
jgi:hypothetical protein